MLVLTRKYQEKIRIGNNITITVLRTKGKAVRLGIEAPVDVPVIRGELSFEAEPETTTATLDGTASEARSSNRTGGRRSDATSAWAADSPRQESSRPREVQQPHVELKRVSRGEVSSFLPKLVPGTAPLRAMMDQR